MSTQAQALATKRKFKMVVKGKEREGAAQFRRIELSLLEEDILLFDLYLFDKERRELVPLMSMGSSLTHRKKKELLGRGIEILYVPIKDKKALDDYVESKLPQVLKSDIPPKRKLELTYNSAQQIMDEVFTNYKDKRNIRRAKSAVSGIVNLFIKEKEALTNIIDLTVHDYYTYTHSLHVCLYGTATALKLYSEKALEKIKHISFGFLMHDIGKTKIDPAILNKPGKLNDDEWKEIKKHPWWGYRILEDIKEITPDAAKIVLHHHERVDGSGYPKGLKGHEMGTLSRICAFCDVFDAMTTNRPYRGARPAYEALTVIRDDMKKLNDPKLFEIFVKIFIEK